MITEIDFLLFQLIKRQSFLLNSYESTERIRKDSDFV